MPQLSNLIRRSRQKPPYQPDARELFTILTATPKKPIWKGTHWINALSLCNAFARVVANSGGVTLFLEIAQHQAGDPPSAPVVCDLSYTFIDRGIMRRVMTFNPAIAGVGDNEAYVIDLTL